MSCRYGTVLTQSLPLSQAKEEAVPRDKEIQALFAGRWRDVLVILVSPAFYDLLSSVPSSNNC